MPSRHILIFTYTTLLTIRLQTTTKNPRGILACWSEQYPDGKDGEVLDENISPNFSDVAFTKHLPCQHLHPIYNSTEETGRHVNDGILVRLG
ncbi:hypothetical protein B0T09DRAFT_81600 [Sordaria sp. MPI-SDFR-AT-0083]|nr:hypothetical protein B0T09DRAFT_81600 [Sordaria sp. MPI-SDFR-AT-0083]